MAGLCAPLSTLRQYPRGYLRMTRGRCGSLLLHRDGLAPSTPCRSPGALRSTPESGLTQYSRLKGAVRDIGNARGHKTKGRLIRLYAKLRAEIRRLCLEPAFFLDIGQVDGVTFHE